MRKTFKKIATMAMAAIMTVGCTISAFAAEYDAYLDYTDSGYWPGNVWYSGADDVAQTTSSTCKVNGAGTYTLTLSIEELATMLNQDLIGWGSTSSGLLKMGVKIPGAGVELKDYTLSDIAIKFDDTAVTVDKSLVSLYVYDDDEDGTDDLGISIYNSWDEWSAANPPFDVTTAGFADKVEITFTLAAPVVTPDPDEDTDAGNDTDTDADTDTDTDADSNADSNADADANANAGATTPDTGDSSMVAMYGLVALVAAAVVLKRRTVTE